MEVGALGLLLLTHDASIHCRYSRFLVFSVIFFPGKPQIPISALLPVFVRIFPESQRIPIAIALSAQSTIGGAIWYPHPTFNFSIIFLISKLLNFWGIS